MVTSITTINATGETEKEVGIAKIIDGRKTFIGVIRPEP